jgi:hypothetical protein
MTELAWTREPLRWIVRAARARDRGARVPDAATSPAEITASGTSMTERFRHGIVATNAFRRAAS